jgi:hypothetical protein
MPIEQGMDDSRPVDGAAPQIAVRAEPPLTIGRFLGALAVACLLQFLLLALFAMSGLGSLGLAPAVVVAMALTSRVTKIRRMSVLVALGALSFVIVVVGTYAIAVAALLNAEPPITG